MTTFRAIYGIGFLLMLSTPGIAAATASPREAWEAFSRNDGAGWTTRWGVDNGAPEMVRPGAATLLNGWKTDRAAAVGTFFTARASLFGLRAHVDELRFAEEREHLGVHHVRMKQFYRGLPVIGGEYMVSVGASGDMRLILGRLATDLSLDVHPKISEKDAVDRALATVQQPHHHYEITSRLAIARLTGADHLVREVALTRSKPLESWLVQVDAVTGEILDREDLVQHATGCTFIYPDHLTGPLTEEDFVLQDQTAPVSLQGSNVKVEDYTTHQTIQSDAQELPSGCWDFRFQPGIDDAAFDQANVYWHIDHFIREFQGANGFPGMPQQITARVRRPDCLDLGNAVGFTIEIPSDCSGRDPCRISDVIYHETEHTVWNSFGLHHSYNPVGNLFNQAIDEASASYFACALNNDPIFLEDINASGYYNMEPDSTQHTYLHIADYIAGGAYLVGQIWSGSLWRIRESIGPITDSIVLESMYYLPSDFGFDCASDAVIQADIDHHQGDHKDRIRDVFANHGINISVPVVTITDVNGGPPSNYLPPDVSGDFKANVCCGLPPYQYLWTKTWTVNGRPMGQIVGSTQTVSVGHPCSFVLKVTATDSRGTSKSATWTVAGGFAPPQVSIVASMPSPISPNTAVQYTATVVGQAPQYTVQWTKHCIGPSFACGPVVVGTGSSVMVSSDRNFVLRATASSPPCNASGFAEITVAVSGVPIATINGPPSLGPGQAADFVASISGGSSPYSYDWTRCPSEVTCSSLEENASSVHVGGAPFDLYLEVTDNGGLGLHSDFALMHVSLAGGALIPAPEAVVNGPSILCSNGLGTGSVKILLDLPRSADVRLAVFDVEGRRLDDLFEGSLGSGRRAFQWGSRASTGVYMVAGWIDGVQIARRFVLVH